MNNEFRVQGGIAVRFVLERLEQLREELTKAGGEKNARGADLRRLAAEGKVSVKLYIPAADDLEEEDFALIFEVEE